MQNAKTKLQDFTVMMGILPTLSKNEILEEKTEKFYFFESIRREEAN